MRYCIALCVAAFTAFGVHAQTSDWPSRAVRIVVPYPPGGISDVLGRVVAQRLSERLGQSFVVDNRAGASGNIGAETVAKAAPDGYTLVVGGPNNFASNQFLYPKLGYDIEKDLTGVTVLEQHPTVLVVPNSLNVADVKAFVAATKAKPKTFNCGTPGVATLGHLSLELFKDKTGADIQNIAFKGTGPVVTEMLGGRLECAFDGLPGHYANIRSGAYRALAVTTPARDKSLPDVPTMIEAGYPDVVATVWFALAAPAKTPPNVLARISDEVNQVLREPAVVAKLEALGATPVGGTPERTNAFFKSEATKWKRIIEVADVKAE